MKLVIIGLSAAGLSALETLLQFAPEAEITAISEETRQPYCRCLLTQYLGREVHQDFLTIRETNRYPKNVTWLLGERVSQIDPEKKSIACASGRTLSFDKLLIAAGAGAVQPEYCRAENRAHTLRFIEDALKIENLAAGKAGLQVPEAKELAGPGLKEICGALGIPPSLHVGSCVDNSRILVIACALANALGVDIDQLPLAGSAPEWYSEKAATIAFYVMASGIFTHLGVMPPILGSKKVTELATKGLNDVFGACFAVEPDPIKAAELIINHILEKRKRLGLAV